MLTTYFAPPSNFNLITKGRREMMRRGAVWYSSLPNHGSSVWIQIIPWALCLQTYPTSGIVRVHEKTAGKTYFIIFTTKFQGIFALFTLSVLFLLALSWILEQFCVFWVVLPCILVWNMKWFTNLMQLSIYLCSFSSTCSGFIRPSSGSMDVTVSLHMQHMVSLV